MYDEDEDDHVLMRTVTGTYDPIPKPPVDGEGPMWKDIKLDTTRAKYWIGVGAQPSDSAWRLLSMVSPLFCVHVCCVKCWIFGMGIDGCCRLGY